MTFSAQQKRAQDLREDVPERVCPWCGDKLYDTEGNFDIVLEGHVLECPIFIKEQGEQ